MKTTHAALLVAFGTMVASVPAQAGGQATDPTAAEFFRAAVAAYERREFRAAALAFEEAYHRVPRSAAIYNAGRCWEAAGDRARAADAFMVALGARDLEEHDAQVARARLAELSPSLATIEAQGLPTATVSVDGVDRGPLPRAIHVAPGEHTVHVVRRDGSVVVRRVTLAAGEVSTVSASSDDVPDPPASPSPSPTPDGRGDANASAPASPDARDVQDAQESPPAPTPVLPLVPEHRPQWASGMPLWGALCIGGSVALTTLGAAMYIKFESDRSSFEASSNHDASLHSSAAGELTAAYVLWGAAGAAAIAAGVAFVRFRLPSPVATSLRLGPGSVAAAFSF
jgi:hypothetical protein